MEKKEQKKVIVIGLTEWKIIVDFIAGLQIPIQNSAIGYQVIQSVNSAKEKEEIK